MGKEGRVSRLLPCYAYPSRLPLAIPCNTLKRTSSAGLWQPSVHRPCRSIRPSTPTSSPFSDGQPRLQGSNLRARKTSIDLLLLPKDLVLFRRRGVL